MEGAFRDKSREEGKGKHRKVANATWGVDEQGNLLLKRCNDDRGRRGMKSYVVKGSIYP